MTAESIAPHLRVCAAIALAAVLGFVGAEGARAAVSSPVANMGENQFVTFGFLESGTVGDWYQSLVQGNEPEVVAEFLEQLESQTASRESAGLGQLSDEQFASFVSAAQEASSLRAERLVGSRATSDLALSPGTSTEAVGTSSFPVIGQPVNGGWSWRYNDRFTYVVCAVGPLFCTTKGTLDIRMTSNPGKTGSMTSLNFLLQGSAINGVKIRSKIYGNGSLVSDVSQTWNVPGYGSQVNSPHVSLLSKSFRATYEVTVLHTGGSSTGSYSTPTSSKCLQPTGAAFRCLFP